MKKKREKTYIFKNWRKKRGVECEFGHEESIEEKGNEMEIFYINIIKFERRSISEGESQIEL